MMTIPCRQALRTTLILAIVAFSLGCNVAHSPASPASGAQSVAPTGGSSQATSSGPRIVGTVLLSSTEKALTGGGVVYLEDAPRQPAVAMTATINVDHKEFTPLISVIATGGTATFGNKDALTHHVFSPNIPQWDTGYLQKNATAVKTFDSPGAVALLCNIHPEMIGYLLVIPSTYFGRVSASGKYVIESVPPGTYRATAWAPRLPTTTQSVVVGRTGTAIVNFELRAAGTTN